MHEQDVRRAVGRPGGLDSPAAVHTVDYLSESLGYVFAKRAGATPGSTVRLDVVGHEPVAYGVDEQGRGRRLPTLPEAPTVTVSTDRESFAVLAGGRRTPPDGAVRIVGDVELGRRLLDLLAVTP